MSLDNEEWDEEWDIISFDSGASGSIIARRDQATVRDKNSLKGQMAWRYFNGDVVDEQWQTPK